MKNNFKFDNIAVEFFTENNHVFSIDDYDDYDCHDTCVIWNSMNFYGIPFDLTDDEMNNVYDGNYSKGVKIGEVQGYLILCKEILYEDEDPWQICDDLDGDLEYTISALKDEDGPLSSKEGDPEQNVYYIHEFKMISEYSNDILLKSKIINELPNLIFTFLHVRPELLAYYPAPLEHSPDVNVEARYEALQNIAIQKLDTALHSVDEDNPNKKSSNNIVKFGDVYQFTEDELNLIMRRRHSGSSYPEEAKDRDEYEFYEKNGFEEVGDSRLLCKHTK